MGRADRARRARRLGRRPVTPTRRAVLAAGAGAAIAASARPAVAASGSLQALVRTYADFGDHRAGSAVDAATRNWIGDLLHDAGAKVTSDAFDIDTFDIGACTLSDDKESISVFPQWPAAPSTTIVAPLRFQRPPGHDEALAGAIAAVRLPFIRSGSLTMRVLADAVDVAAASGAAAFVGVTEGPTGETIIFNAPEDRTAWPIPVVLCGSGRLPFLYEKAASARPVRLVIKAAPARLRTANLIATFDRPGPATIVTTPTTGWFRCAGERGSGVAVLIRLARWAAKRSERFVFALTSAHELGDVGALRFAKNAAPGPDKTRTWIRLGAGLGARAWSDARGVLRPLPSGDDQRFIVADAATARVAKTAFKGQPGLEAPVAFDPSAPGLKEAQELMRRGYQRYLLTFGFHLLHHTMLDDATTTDERILEEAASGVIDTLSRTQ